MGGCWGAKRLKTQFCTLNSLCVVSVACRRRLETILKQLASLGQQRSQCTFAQIFRWLVASGGLHAALAVLVAPASLAGDSQHG